jgi:NADP-dependent 3-hydroxy acid dehydrogenase YdfG
VSKTIVVFGAGTGLGSAVARRFGREGFRIALVARTRTRLDELVTDLGTEGIEAAAFPADLTRTAEIPALVSAIRNHFGRIDVVEYAPITTEDFVPARALTADLVRPYLDLFLLTPIEIIQAVLPEFIERGDGAVLLGQGVSATHPMPGLSGPGPAMAGARNYLRTLHDEIAAHGVQVSVVHVAALVLGSAGHTAMTSGELAGGLDLSQIPQVEPADIADAFWKMYTNRDQFEQQIPSF